VNNQKDFRVVNRISKAFSFILSNFPFALTLIFRITMRMPLTFLSKIISHPTITIVTKKISLVISAMKLTEHPVATIKSGIMRTLYTIKESIKFTIDFISGINIMDFRMGLRERTTAAISQHMPITFSILLAVFNYLGTFDPEILGDLDTQTLGDMDYTIIT